MCVLGVSGGELSAGVMSEARISPGSNGTLSSGDGRLDARCAVACC